MSVPAASSGQLSLFPGDKVGARSCNAERLRLRGSYFPLRPDQEDVHGPDWPASFLAMTASLVWV